MLIIYSIRQPINFKCKQVQHVLIVKWDFDNLTDIKSKQNVNNLNAIITDFTV